MPLIKRNKEDLNTAALREYAQALAEKNAALIEFLAIMCDVDIPEEEVSDNES